MKAVCAVLLLVGAAIHGAAPEPLTIMSFNIRYGTANDGENRWELRRGQLFGLLKAHNPDVIGLRTFWFSDTPALPVVVTGDFNTGEANPATQAMLRVFRDTFRVLHPDVKDVGTGNQFKLGMTTGDRIDYIFVEPGTEVLTAEIVRTAAAGRYPSDHFPVVARVRLR